LFYVCLRRLFCGVCLRRLSASFVLRRLFYAVILNAVKDPRILSLLVFASLLVLRRCLSLEIDRSPANFHCLRRVLKRHQPAPNARNLLQASAKSLSFFAKQNRSKSSPFPGLKNADPATEATPVFASSALAFSAAVAPGKFPAEART
jgi:hypothetical protein